jgi:hypothetical protein
MSTVAKEMGIRRLVKGDIGVEIEVEGRNLPLRVSGWRSERDGSLKGEENIEYVLAEPATLQGVSKALATLDKAYQAHDSRVDDTVRAGVHIHINCQHLTMTQLYNFMTIYLILENVLVKWCGDYREGNLFCLRSCDAEYMLAIVRQAALDEKKAYRIRFHTDELRYASMNVKALGDYGSLEFRAMRGTRDLDLIYKWAESLYNIREFAKKFDKPSDIIEQFSFDGAETFLDNAVGENSVMFKAECGDELQSMLFDGMRCAQDIAYSRDWATFEPKMKDIGGLEFPEGVEFPDEPEDDF